MERHKLEQKFINMYIYVRATWNFFFFKFGFTFTDALSHRHSVSKSVLLEIFCFLTVHFFSD